MDTKIHYTQLGFTYDTNKVDTIDLFEDLRKIERKRKAIEYMERRQQAKQNSKQWCK
jgi:hypothetical protein